MRKSEMSVIVLVIGVYALLVRREETRELILGEPPAVFDTVEKSFFDTDYSFSLSSLNPFD